MLTSPRDLAQRRRVLFTMLTALRFRCPTGTGDDPPFEAWLGAEEGRATQSPEVKDSP